MTCSSVHIWFDGDNEDWDIEGIIGGWRSKQVKEPSQYSIWSMEQNIEGEGREAFIQSYIWKDNLYAKYFHSFSPRKQVFHRKEVFITLFYWAPKSQQMVTAAVKLKDTCSLEEKLWQA